MTGWPYKKLFTLIELLVVIGIIAILLTILLPALKKARDKVKSTVCKNKQKQLFVAYNSYISDAGGFLAPMGVYPDECSPAGPEYGDGGYYGVLAEYVNDPKGNTTYFYRHGWSFFTEAKSRQPIYFCPSGTNELQCHTGSGSFTNFGFNRCVIISMNDNCARLMSQIHKPSMTFFLFDGYYNGMEMTYYLAADNTDPYAAITAARVDWTAHNKGANFSWMDGHVERVPVSLARDWTWFAKRRYNSSHYYFW